MVMSRDQFVFDDQSVHWRYSDKKPKIMRGFLIVSLAVLAIAVTVIKADDAAAAAGAAAGSAAGAAAPAAAGTPAAAAAPGAAASSAAGTVAAATSGPTGSSANAGSSSQASSFAGVIPGGNLIGRIWTLAKNDWLDPMLG
ncbi:uncharacterized protein LOC141534460 [Cotesia typhae]|uniref:uncharacterized protein LOC141534460 n=1 Tax=Cotesia typhae TaxID=2053667 RepID=UPI003D69777D